MKTEEITKPKLSEVRNSFIEKPKYYNAEKEKDQTNEFESTAYKINKSRFFMDEPDEKLTMKKDAEEFYGGSQHGDAPNTMRNHHEQSMAQENVHSNLQKNHLRSTVGKAGNTILRSSSMTKLRDAEIDNPIINRNGINRTSLNDNPYKYK
jgi:hypothetical protein